MERKIYKIIFLIIVVTINFSNTGYKEKIYDAFISGEMNKWKEVIDEMEKKKNKTDEEILELVNYHYGYIAWCVGNDKEEDADKYLEVAEKHLSYFEKKKIFLSEVHSYRAAFIGFEIGMSIFKAPFIGPKSIRYAKKAIELDKNNPFAYIENGNIEYYMPGIFGGSTKEAIKYYLQALKIMESKEEWTKQNWNYLNLLVLLYQAYEDIDEYKKAKFYLEKILSIEPNFVWVRDELYPNVLREMKDNK
ncbi:MAG: hypothetical protein JW866_01230 [Ignavibacteriales bacterium]|nr:hypothetical protein [Ignavibacteriales bacterium]